MLLHSKYFVLGPPGAGKSTSAQLLARSEGYVYYEADCFGLFVNPFIDPNLDEPTLAVSNQRPLKVKYICILISYVLLLFQFVFL